MSKLQLQKRVDEVAKEDDVDVAQQGESRKAAESTLVFFWTRRKTNI